MHGLRVAYVCWLAGILGVVYSVPCSALDWQAPAGCLTPEQAEARLRETVDPEASRSVHVQLDRFATGEWRARIRWPDAEVEQERVLYAADCAELARAALLVLELSLPERAKDIDASRARSADESAHGWQLSARAAGLVDSGALPRTAFAVSALLAVELDRWLLEAGGSYFIPREKQLADEITIEIGLAAAALRSCLRVLGPTRGFGQLSLSTCAAVELGRTRGRAEGLLDVERVSGLWAAAAPAIAFASHAWRVVRPELLVELSLPFRRPSFDVDGLGSAFQAAPVALRVALGLRFGLFTRERAE